jgi:RHS repeat-associated protein
VTDGEGIITHTTFNEFGNVVSVTENYTGTNTRTTQYKYDKLGRRIETIDPANHGTQTKYDEAGNVSWVIDANQNKTSYYYDRLNRQTEIVDANNILTQQTKYDGFGNVKSIKDSGNNVTEYDYDELNRQIKMIDPRGKSVAQDYDALSRVKWVEDRNNRRRDFSYDINDNLTKEAWGNGIQLQYIYDKVGNLKQSIDRASNTTNIYNYDAIYQLTDATTGNVNFHYDYDVYGDLTQRQERVNSLQTVTLDYQYDKNHQLKKLSQSGLGVISQVMDLGYDRLNQLTNISRTTANATGALVTDYQYNQVGLLKDINNYFVKPTVFNPVTTISNYHYDYDAGNRLTIKNGTDGNSVIDYGKDNQLKSVDNSSRADEVYNFNALGIRNNWSTVTGDSRQVQNDGKFEYKYDDEGNLTRKTELASGNITNYEWDYRNRLSKVSSASQIVEYQYDAEDRRVGKAINGITQEKYLYDGQDIALVVGNAGTITERYLYGSGVDNVLSKEANGQVTWSLGDKQGSIVDLVNEQGAILNHFVYDSFGNRTGTTSADFRFGYTGRELDAETGLYYYRARYYDSAVGRFISEDPIGFSAGDTNLYRYVSNSPTNYTDPSGKVVPLLAIGAALLSAGLTGATIGGTIGFARGAAESIDSDRRNGILSWDSIGSAYINGLIGGVKGAAIGFGAGVGIAALGMGAIALGVPAMVVGGIGATLATVSVGAGVISAGVNISQGNYATAAVDIAGALYGANKLWSGYQIAQQRAFDNGFRNARQVYQDPQLPGVGQIVPVQSSALATTPPGWNRAFDGALVASSLLPSFNPTGLLAPALLDFNPNLYNHMTIVEGLSQQQGILGGHTRQAFYEYVENTMVVPYGGIQPINQIKINSETPHPNIPGLSQIHYSILKGRKLGGFENQYKQIKDPKTIWDSNIIPDNYIIELGKSAAAKNYHANVAIRKFAYTSEAGGIQFRVYVDEVTGIIRNIHPKIGKQ